MRRLSKRICPDPLADDNLPGVRPHLFEILKFIGTETDGFKRQTISSVPRRTQNLNPSLMPSTRGRSGTSDLMNCADEVNRLASELLRFVP